MKKTTALLTLFLANCGGHKKSSIHYVVEESDSSGDTAGESDSTAGGEGEEAEIALADLQSSYGMKNFSQINETMSVLTGASPLTPAILAVYTEVRTSLPSNNDIRSFLASQQSGISKLATEYCDAAVNNVTLRTRIVPSLNAAVAPSIAFNAAGQVAVAKDFKDAFWPRGTENLPDEELVSSTISELYAGILGSGLPATGASTLNIAKGICVVFLSASPVLIF